MTATSAAADSSPPGFASRIRASFMARIWPKLLVIRAVAEACPRDGLLLGSGVLLSAVGANGVRIAAGLVIANLFGELDGASSGSLDGEVLLLSAFFTASVLGPVATAAFGRRVSVALTAQLQRRLMVSVSGPSTLDGLDTPAAQTRIAQAQGILANFQSAEAPMSMATLWSGRLDGFLAAGILAYWYPLPALLLVVVWIAIRQRIRETILDNVRLTGRQARVVQRAHYFEGLSLDPAGGKEARVFGLGDWQVEQYRTHHWASLQELWFARKKLNRSTIGLAVIALAAQGAVFGWLAYAAAHDRVPLSAMVTMLLCTAAISSLAVFGAAGIGLEFQLDSYEHLHALEQEMPIPAPDRRGGGTGQPAAEPNGQPLRLSRLSFAYPHSSGAVFTDLSFDIPAGRTTAIVGVNGAGKTTLVKLITGLYLPSGGAVLLGEKDSRGFDARRWQRKFACVFQDFGRYPITARGNIALGAPEFADDLVGIRAAAAKAGVLDELDALPAGLDSVLSSRYTGGTDLSAGQWQRVAIARAFFAVQHGADTLILDEPTAWMDAQHEQEFFERFIEVTAGLSTIIISHRFSTVRRADEIVVLDGGEMVERGSHEELLETRGRYARMFRLQAEQFADLGSEA